MTWTAFPHDAVAWIAGERTRYRSSASVQRGFCATCGTSLTYEVDAEGADVSELIFIATATLDDPTTYPPEEIIRCEEKIDWMDLGQRLPQMPRFSEKGQRFQKGGGQR